jgi:hypothetical protein
MRLARKLRGVRIGQAFAHYKTVLVLTSDLRAKRVGEASNAPLAKLFALAYNIDQATRAPKKRKHKKRAHYEIIGPLTRQVIGCTDDKADAQSEEPDATIVRVAKDQCRSCASDYLGGMAGDQGQDAS